MDPVLASVMGVRGTGRRFSLQTWCAHPKRDEPLTEWFYVTEYISSVLLLFLDLSRQIVVVLSN